MHVVLRNLSSGSRFLAVGFALHLSVAAAAENAEVLSFLPTGVPAGEVRDHISETPPVDTSGDALPGSGVFAGPFLAAGGDYGTPPVAPHLSLVGDRLFCGYMQSGYGLAQSRSFGYWWNGVDPRFYTGNATTPGGVAALNRGVGTLFEATPTEPMLASQLRFATFTETMELVSRPSRVDLGPAGPDRALSYPRLLSTADALIAVWRESFSGQNRRFKSARSFDDGRTWIGEVHIHDDPLPPAEFHTAVAAAPDGTLYAVVPLVTSQFMVVRSDDLGASWVPVSYPTDPRFIHAFQASIAVASDGTIGMVTHSAEPWYTPPTSNWFWRSDDRGVTWTTPIQLESGQSNDFRPEIRTGPEGRWHVAWNANSPFAFDINAYYSVSDDASGASWSPPVRINEIPSTSPGRVSLVVDSGGYAVVAMTAPLGSLGIHIYTTRRRDVPVVAVGAVEAVARAWPNPFTSRTSLTMSDAWTGGSLRLFDVSGRLIREWNDVTGARVHPLIWDGNDRHGRPAPPGVYYLRAADERSLHATTRVVRVRR